MTKITGYLMLLVGSAMFAIAIPVGAPEIDPASGMSALTLLAGGLLVLRAKRQK